MEVEVKVPGREELYLELKLSKTGNILKSRLTGIGGSELLSLIEEWRPRLNGDLGKLEPPTGNSPACLLLRELILKAQGNWNPPFESDELCHCRAVATKVVEAAVVAGAHTPEEVSRWTSASTACGTCRPDVESILKYRLT